MAHIHEKIDFAADTFIVNGDAVLLRMHDKYKTWFAPGGHVELDEDPSEAAIREAYEEVGLKVALVGEIQQPLTGGDIEVLVPRFINRHRINETHEHISFVYFATADTREITQGETEISEHIKWFTREELDEPSYEIWDRIKFYAKEALTAVAAETVTK